MKFGDAGTKFFHANATLKHRRKAITCLKTNDGIKVYSYEAKADLLWSAYKDRLGSSNTIQMPDNLEDLIPVVENLDLLDSPFTHEEIDNVVNNLPTDKAPGPDGFNTDFIKKCWPIIKTDFYALCESFRKGEICLQSINGSLITLLPKIVSPSSIGDYRPISFLNCSTLITKLLANRLQLVIMQLVHRNQYGFIKTKTIQDCLAWSFEYLHLCHKSRKEIIILKLGFEKAFDRMEHLAMLELMKVKGFSDTWLSWMQAIFTSGTSSVLLNGEPGKTFYCRRGVRQGDPLSPLLFILAADLLQSLVNKAVQEGLLNLPIPCFSDQHFPIIQHADDTLIIMEGCHRQLQVLKDILNIFTTATGFTVNFHKSMMIPLNISEESLEVMATSFNCDKGSLPFTYLGLPLGTAKPKIEELLPLVSKCERRLQTTSMFVSQAGRLQMTNAVFTSIPLFQMGTFMCPKQ